MRGTPSHHSSAAFSSGLIPTYAGNTVAVKEEAAPARAHPHVCGEHPLSSILRIQVPGSSPRMRGTRFQRFRRLVLRGLIPTYAGNTHVRVARRADDRAHPHVCGEHNPWNNGTGRTMGSSPRMRGTPSLIASRLSILGLIPTYAGNTPSARRLSAMSRAHPHVCGEHLRSFARTFSPSGSSPRMRGTHDGFSQDVPQPWLIPTYAGNTLSRLIFSFSDRAHPHVCGEHFCKVVPGDFTLGSSPRMRGTRPVGEPGPKGPGLIPTYAGNTVLLSYQHIQVGAHPHVCGEHAPVSIRNL